MMFFNLWGSNLGVKPCVSVYWMFLTTLKEKDLYGKVRQILDIASWFHRLGLVLSVRGLVWFDQACVGYTCTDVQCVSLPE